MDLEVCKEGLTVYGDVLVGHERGGEGNRTL